MTTIAAASRPSTPAARVPDLLRRVARDVGDEETNHNAHREPSDGRNLQRSTSRPTTRIGGAAHRRHHDDARPMRRHDDHGHGHGHGGEPLESPPIMLYPLYVLAVGALCAGILLHHVFIGEGRKWFWGEALVYAATNHIFDEMEQDPCFVPLLPSLMFVVGLGVAYYVYMMRPGTARAVGQGQPAALPVPAQQVVLRRALRLVFVRPAFWLGRLFWKGGDQAIIDGFGPDGIAARAATRPTAS